MKLKLGRDPPVVVDSNYIHFSLIPSLKASSLSLFCLFLIYLLIFLFCTHLFHAANAARI